MDTPPTADVDGVKAQAVAPVNDFEKFSAEELKMLILQELPEMIAHQRSCAHGATDISCRVNSKLLHYFMKKEFSPKEKSVESKPVPPHAQPQYEVGRPSRDAMKITACPHVNRKHYAKNMCSTCYRKHGRDQKAWRCEHTDQVNYSMGLCQTCYLSDYHKRQLDKKRVQKQLSKDLSNEVKSCRSVSGESIVKLN